jgi:hypothetical protein
MSSILYSVRAILFAMPILLAAGSPALAKKGASWLTYTAPFTCGHHDPGDGSAVGGDYATSVTNVNPVETRIRARVQITDPSPEESDRVAHTLDAGRSIKIDCEDLLDDAFILPVGLDGMDFFQGVLTIESRARLSVVVQTSAAGLDGGISVENRQVDAVVIRRRRERDSSNVEICHIPPGNPGSRHTIYVGESAVNAHLAHGDHTGSCRSPR